MHALFNVNLAKRTRIDITVILHELIQMYCTSLIIIESKRLFGNNILQQKRNPLFFTFNTRYYQVRAARLASPRLNFLILFSSSVHLPEKIWISLT